MNMGLIMNFRKLSTYLVLLSFYKIINPNVVFAETIPNVSVIKNMNSTFEVVKKTGSIPISCETSGTFEISNVNTKEIECQQRLDAAGIKVMNCMEVYLKSLDSNKSSPVNCNGMAKPSPDELVAEQKILADALGKVISKFGDEDPELVLSKLSVGERKLFEGFLKSMEELNEAQKSSPDQIQKKKEVKAAKMAKNLNSVKDLGFDLISIGKGEKVKLQLNIDKFNPEKLKDINAPEYQAIEALLGSETALNFKKMYAVSNDLKRGGVVAVIIGDQVITPNYGSTNSVPKIMTKKEFDDLEREHFKKFMTYSEQCLRLSEKYGSTWNTVKQFGKGVGPAIVGIGLRDEVLEEKLACETKMSQELYYLHATLGLNKEKTLQIISQAREQARIDGQNIEKVISTIDSISKAQKGVLIASAIVATGGLVGVATGSGIVAVAVWGSVGFIGTTAAYDTIAASVEAVLS